MKSTFWSLLIVSLPFTLAANATIVVWTNTAVITSDGTYTVAISTDATVARITLGDSAGTQTVSPASTKLTH
jgi:hypothetical protein